MRQQAESSEAVLEAELDSLRTEAQLAAATALDAQRARVAAEAQADRLARELGEQATSLGDRLREAEERATSRVQALQDEVTSADQAAAAAKEDARRWAERAEEAQAEVAAVRERAQALMEEKDAQIAQAKARSPISSNTGGRSASPEPPIVPTSILRREDSAPLLKRTVSFAEIEPASPRDPPGGRMSEAQAEIDTLQRQLDAMRKDLADRQHTEKLRDRAAAVLKQEVEEMQRREKRAAVDLTYVKGVLVSGFESNELSVHSAMLPILDRLLQFTPDDKRRLEACKQKQWLPPWQP
mmetsp:Transcript_17584/g.52817  ORF Transcript_17584/g.52817 Transcript_17584/m.52817 type:complete len:298 (-) Transcript_17584:984-1877(-)